ncbi:chorismate mutase [Cupriavidus basilensis]
MFRPERELQVIRKVQAANPGPLLGESVASIWREVMSACRGLEKAARDCFPRPGRDILRASALCALRTRSDGCRARASMRCSGR